MVFGAFAVVGGHLSSVKVYVVQEFVFFLSSPAFYFYMYAPVSIAFMLNLLPGLCASPTRGPVFTDHAREQSSSPHYRV